MNRVKRILTLMFIVTFIFVTIGGASAHPQPYQYYSGKGGEIRGYVFGVDKEPFDWAAVYARNAQRTFQAFSGMSGFYEMRVPPGTYNLTINVPGYQALVTNITDQNGATAMKFYVNSMNITVSDGSLSVVNFYLQQPQMPVPEIQVPVTLLLLICGITSALRLKRLKD